MHMLCGDLSRLCALLRCKHSCFSMLLKIFTFPCCSISFKAVTSHYIPRIIVRGHQANDLLWAANQNNLDLLDIPAKDCPMSGWRPSTAR